jgi:hypothetical protein
MASGPAVYPLPFGAIRQMCPKSYEVTQTDP